MYIINEENQINDLKDNEIIGNVTLNNSKIIFKGVGNILYCEKNVVLNNATIQFNGNNSVIFLSQNKHSYILNLSITHNSFVYIGRNCFFNGKLNLVASEQKNILIGDSCMFSFDCWLRTGDAHLIYDAQTKKRINHSKSIYIGDHVWVGQHVFLLKGCMIGSGSVIGGMSVVSNKKVESNSIFAGNPAKRVKQNIFFSDRCSHLYLDEQTEASNNWPNNDYIYVKDASSLSFKTMEEAMASLNAKEKLEYLKKHVSSNKNKNKFAMQPIQQKTGILFKLKSRF